MIDCGRPAAMLPADQPPSVRNEQGLVRQLSSVQQTMMAIGGAIGTGLFLATFLSVRVAGPAVIVSYAIMAGVSLLLGRALTDLAVAHPTAGAFGVHAEIYLSPLAGYAVRASYWLMEVIATGAQLVAAATYMSFWIDDVPGAVWVMGFGAALIYVNSRAVGWLGAVESWLVMIKIAALALFVVIAALIVAGATGQPAIGLHNLTAGGFAPLGAKGVWFGSCFAIYSFIGIEIVGVTSGEAADPARTIPAAMRRLVIALSAIYIVTVALLIAVLPWQQIDGRGSPFVAVLAARGVPAAASVMNFVVLSAALSSSNANLYLISRTLFSLARAGYVPDRLGAVSRRGAPVNALLVSSIGIAAAALVKALWSDTAYQTLFGISLFGALFVWLMIFATHIAFRRAARPVGSYAGALAIIAVLVSTRWVPGLEVTLVTGVPWLVAVGLGYLISRTKQPR